MAGLTLHIAAPSADGGDISARGVFERAVQEDIRREWGLTVLVTALPLRPQPRLPWSLLEFIAALRFGWSLPIYRASSRRAIRALRRGLTTDTTLVIAHRLTTMMQLLKLRTTVPIVLDLDDIEHAKALQIPADGPSFYRRMLRWQGLRALKAAERAACARAVRTLVCSKVAVDYLRSEFNGEFASIPNAVNIPSRTVELSRSKVMLMVGIYSYHPNADAAQFFIREVFPIIRQKVPDAEVWFAGRGQECIAPDCRDASGVKILGFQLRLDPLYAQARLAICPIRFGGGTRIKIIEAAAFSVPCVSTTMGAEGLQFDNGESVLIGDTALDFAEQCIMVLTDHALAVHVGAAARTTTISMYSRDAQMRALATLFQEVQRSV